ncbi:hypothetical protein F2Q69_00051096 [Brassica cretica]|uniref:NYN domain-containing protein n=1 Tax=Brassica cretica TaxID=69181 RepID=A0A8S9PXE9_BRACR|nr:hypothetical protein F2Q69_00051096 [Brassica cretica]
MKECPVPEGIDAHRVRPSIEGGFKELGYSGPVSITAYGDQKQTPEYLLRALSSTGVAVVHIRSGLLGGLDPYTTQTRSLELDDESDLS